MPLGKKTTQFIIKVNLFISRKIGNDNLFNLYLIIFISLITALIYWLYVIDEIWVLWMALFLLFIFSIRKYMPYIAGIVILGAIIALFFAFPLPMVGLAILAAASKK